MYRVSLCLAIWGCSLLSTFTALGSTSLPIDLERNSFIVGNALLDTLPKRDSIFLLLDLSGERFKEGIIGVPEIKKKKIPGWIYIIPGGGAIYLITTLIDDPGDEDDGPVAIDDEITANCNESILIDVLNNDRGNDISLQNTPTSPDAQISRGTDDILNVSGFGSRSFSFTYTIVDKNGKASSAVVTVDVIDTDPPEISCTPLSVTYCPGNVPEPNFGSVNATDNCDDEPSIEFEDGPLEGSPCNGIIKRRWTATDNFGNTSTCIQDITLVDNIPPLVTCPEDIQLGCNATVPSPDVTMVQASDDCSDPEVQHVGDVVSVEPCHKIVMREYQAVDECGYSASCIQQITILLDSLPPTINCPEDIELTCNSEIPSPDVSLVEVMDNCSKTEVQHVGDVVSIESCYKIVMREYQALDECGNSASCIQEIKINLDSVPPTISCPEDITLSCEDDISPENTGYPEVQDNCTIDSLLEVSYSDTIVSGIDCPRRIERSWIAVDQCGNADTCIQEILLRPDCPTYELILLEITQPYCNTSRDGSVLIGISNPTVTAPFELMLNGVNAGTYQNNTILIPRLKAGFYTAQVTDNNGCISNPLDFNLTSGCVDYELTLLETVPPTCPGINDGEITFAIFDTCALEPFTVFVNGTNLGARTSRRLTLSNVPVGNHTIQVFDFYSCPSQLLQVNFPANCEEYEIEITNVIPPTTPQSSDGVIFVEINNECASPPFQVFFNDLPYSLEPSRSFQITGVSEGVHTIHVVDEFGCQSEIAIVDVFAGNDFLLTLDCPEFSFYPRFDFLNFAPAGGAYETYNPNGTGSLNLWPTRRNFAINISNRIGRSIRLGLSLRYAELPLVQPNQFHKSTSLGGAVIFSISPNLIFQPNKSALIYFTEIGRNVVDGIMNSTTSGRQGRKLIEAGGYIRTRIICNTSDFSKAAIELRLDEYFGQIYSQFTLHINYNLSESSK